MKIYLAGPCDTENRTMMVSIAKILRENGHVVYCPWELKIENAWDMPQEEWAKKVFDADVTAINVCEIMIVISIGRESTAGTNWEQGYAFAKGIPTHVIQITDKSTSLMTYWGSNSFINYNRQYNSLKNNLFWAIDHYNEISHEKCRTVLT